MKSYCIRTLYYASAIVGFMKANNINDVVKCLGMIMHPNPNLNTETNVFVKDEHGLNFNIFEMQEFRSKEDWVENLDRKTKWLFGEIFHKEKG